MVLWFFAACVLTFDGPFNVTGNGFFGTWAAMFCALAYAYQEFVGGDLPLGASLRQSFGFAPMTESEPPLDKPEGANVA